MNRLRLGDIGPPRLEKLAEDSRDLHLVALCLLNHAEVLVALDRPTVARQNAEAAERMFQESEAALLR